MRNRYVNMLEGNLITNILRFYFPLVLSSLLQILFNTADVIVVGNFAGEDALAAVSSTGSLINLLVGLFVGVSTGTNVLLAKYLGANDEKRIFNMIHTSIFFAIISGIFLTFMGIIFSDNLLMLMQVPSNIFSLSALYLRIYFVGTMASLLYNFSAAILRSKGDTKRPLYFLTIAGISNVLLNLLLVIVFKLSVAGVAIATVASQIISATLCILSLLKEESNLKLHPKEIKADKESLINLLKFGLPAGLSGSLFSLSNVVIQSSINTFGSVVMAGNGAAANIESYTWTAMNGFMHACQSFVAQNYGAKNIKRIKNIIFICLLFAIMISILVGGLSFIFGRQAIGIFTDSSDAIDAGLIRLNYVVKWYFLDGIMELLGGALRGLGYSLTPTLIILFGVCVFRLIWISTIFKNNPIIENVYIAYPISWTIALSILAIMLIYLYLRVKKSINEDILNN